MLTAYKEFWRRYVDFKGRSTRSEFWYAFLVNFLISLMLLITCTLFFIIFLGATLGDQGEVSDVAYFLNNIGTLIGSFILAYFIYGIFCLTIFLPQLAIIVRRLRDAGYHWAFVFLAYAPSILSLVSEVASYLYWPCLVALIILLCQPTKYDVSQVNNGYNNQGGNQPFGQGQPGQAFGQNGPQPSQPFGANNQNFNQGGNQPFGQAQPGQPFPQNNQTFNQETANQAQNLNQASAQPFGQNGQQPSQPFGQNSQNFNQGQAAEPVASQPFGQNTQNFNQGQAAEPVVSQPFPQAQPVEAAPLAETEAVQANQASEPIQPAEPFGQAFTQAEPSPTEEAKSAPEAETGESSNSEE